VVKHQANRSDINDHPHHDKPGSYLSTVGDKQFTGKSGLNRHKRIHTGDKPFICATCNKRFTCTEQLQNHEITHSGEKLYSCSQCEKQFLTTSGFRNHMNIHAGKYRCTECGQCCHSGSHLTKQTESFRRETD